MNLQEAIDAPAFHTDHFPSSFYPRESAPVAGRRGAGRRRRCWPSCAAAGTRSRSCRPGRWAGSARSPAATGCCTRRRTRAACRATRSAAERGPRPRRAGGVCAPAARTPAAGRRGRRGLGARRSDAAGPGAAGQHARRPRRGPEPAAGRADPAERQQRRPRPPAPAGPARRPAPGPLRAPRRPPGAPWTRPGARRAGTPSSATPSTPVCHGRAGCSSLQHQHGDHHALGPRAAGRSRPAAARPTRAGGAVDRLPGPAGTTPAGPAGRRPAATQHGGQPVISGAGPAGRPQRQRRPGHAAAPSRPAAAASRTAAPPAAAGAPGLPGWPAVRTLTPRHHDPAGVRGERLVQALLAVPVHDRDADLAQREPDRLLLQPPDPPGQPGPAPEPARRLGGQHVDDQHAEPALAQVAQGLDQPRLQQRAEHQDQRARRQRGPGQPGQTRRRALPARPARHQQVSSSRWKCRRPEPGRRSSSAGRRS